MYAHRGFIDSSHKVVEEIRRMEEGGGPGYSVVTPLEIAEEGTCCEHVCLCTCDSVGHE